jgi:hypothetical protein
MFCLFEPAEAELALSEGCVVRNFAGEKTTYKKRMGVSG